MKYTEIVNWWESKRKGYNLVLIGFSIFVLITEFRHQIEYEIDLVDNFLWKIFFFIVWIGGANIFYCLGSGFEITCKYYEKELSNTGRLSLYVFGIVVSVLWTLLGIISWWD